MDVMQAFTGLSHAVTLLRSMKEVSGSIDSMARVAEVQDALIRVQSEVLRLQQMTLQLQEENRELRLGAERANLKAGFDLLRTKVGAVVYKARQKPGEIEYYVCPLCIEKGQQQVLQQRGHVGMSCNECKNYYQFERDPSDCF